MEYTLQSQYTWILIRLNKKVRIWTHRKQCLVNQILYLHSLVFPTNVPSPCLNLIWLHYPSMHSLLRCFCLTMGSSRPPSSWCLPAQGLASVSPSALLRGWFPLGPAKPWRSASPPAPWGTSLRSYSSLWGIPSAYQPHVQVTLPHPITSLIYLSTILYLSIIVLLGSVQYIPTLVDKTLVGMSRHIYHPKHQQLHFSKM